MSRTLSRVRCWKTWAGAHVFFNELRTESFSDNETTERTKGVHMSDENTTNVEHADDNPVVARIRAAIAPIVSDLGLELYDLEFGAGLLKVTVDTLPGSAGGVDVDQLTRCTRLINREFEHSDPVPGNYTLEVSSPGLERNLRLPRHFEREIGKTVAVRLRDVVNGERRINGVLVAADAEGFTVRLDDLSERRVAYHQFDRARTVFVWEAAPKPGRKAGQKIGPKAASKSASKARSPKDSPVSTAESTPETVQESDES